jgi:hypothetical protein
MAATKADSSLRSAPSKVAHKPCVSRRGAAQGEVPPRVIPSVARNLLLLVFAGKADFSSLRSSE